MTANANRIATYLAKALRKQLFSANVKHIGVKPRLGSMTQAVVTSRDVCGLWLSKAGRIKLEVVEDVAVVLLKDNKVLNLSLQYKIQTRIPWILGKTYREQVADRGTMNKLFARHLSPKRLKRREVGVSQDRYEIGYVRNYYLKAA